MKKIFLSIITFLYLAMSSGIAMEVHYCMGKKAGIDFFKTENEKCSRCGMKESKTGCCNDEHKFYKLSTEHKNVSADYNFTIFQSIITGDNAPNIVSAYPSVVVSLISFHSSPPGKGKPIYIKNCVFRI